MDAERSAYSGVHKRGGRGGRRREGETVMEKDSICFCVFFFNFMELDLYNKGKIAQIS